MDGVPDVTQEPVAPGASFVYDFVAEPAGIYMYHSHAGLQLDRGLDTNHPIDGPIAPTDLDIVHQSVEPRWWMLRVDIDPDEGVGAVGTVK